MKGWVLVGVALVMCIVAWGLFVADFLQDHRSDKPLMIQKVSKIERLLVKKDVTAFVREVDKSSDKIMIHGEREEENNSKKPSGKGIEEGEYKSIAPSGVISVDILLREVE